MTVPPRVAMGAMLPATLVALAALGLLASSAFHAAALEQRMARYSAAQQQLFAAADNALQVVEDRLAQAIDTGDSPWLAASASAQPLSGAAPALSLQYQVHYCCETLWNPQLPAGAGNVASLYHLAVSAQQAQVGNLSLHSIYLVSETSAGAVRGRRVGWRQTR